MESQKGGADDAASLVAVGDEGAEAEKLARGEEYRKARRRWLGRGPRRWSGPRERGGPPLYARDLTSTP